MRFESVELQNKGSILCVLVIPWCFSVYMDFRRMRLESVKYPRASESEI